MSNTLSNLTAHEATMRANAKRYEWLRACLWNQELSAYSSDRLWLWSTRFASPESSGGDMDPLTQGQELDAAIDARLAEEA